MGREKNYIGRRGEICACAYLKKRRYRIIATNFRTPFGELDIVARHKKTLVFIEVKTRATSSLGPPYLAVTRAKERHIIKNALFYLKRRKLSDTNWRIDIVSVKLNCAYEVENIELFENAVEDPYI